jgi:hypothetical protein
MKTWTSRTKNRSRCLVFIAELYKRGRGHMYVQLHTVHMNVGSFPRCGWSDPQAYRIYSIYEYVYIYVWTVYMGLPTGMKSRGNHIYIYMI